jgi:hypothetical protein
MNAKIIMPAQKIIVLVLKKIELITIGTSNQNINGE